MAKLKKIAEIKNEDKDWWGIDDGEIYTMKVDLPDNFDGATVVKPQQGEFGKEDPLESVIPLSVFEDDPAELEIKVKTTDLDEALEKLEKLKKLEKLSKIDPNKINPCIDIRKTDSDA